MFLDNKRKETHSPSKTLREKRDTKADDKKSKSMQKISSGLSINKTQVKPTSTHKSEKRLTESGKHGLAKRSSASLSQDNEEIYQNSGLKQLAAKSTSKNENKISE